MSNIKTLRIIVVGTGFTPDQLDHLKNSLAVVATVDGKVSVDCVETHAVTDIAQVTDGYHSFDELYQHRHALFIALCCELRISGTNVWYSHTHHDGSGYPGWVLVGADLRTGLDANGDVTQISYHLPATYIPHLDAAGVTFASRAPYWDGHTSHDVIDRLLAAYGDSATRITTADVEELPDGDTWPNDDQCTVIYKDANNLIVVSVDGADWDRTHGERSMQGHVYMYGMETKPLDMLLFQQGPIPQYGVNGITNEALLATLIHRTEHLNSQFPCNENEVALEHMRAALRAFEARATRMASQVK